jgi:hypothetical protein
MTREVTLKHEFVDSIPQELAEGTVYVSVGYATASHNCACGCGYRVVTPLSPTGWRLTFDGDSISLNPSIGNWNFPCRSHYFITRNRVEWAPRWTDKEIKEGRAYDRVEKERFYKERHESSSQEDRPSKGWRRRIRDWFFDEFKT